MPEADPPQALVVYSQFDLAGGGTAVAAWTLEALKDVCRVSLLSWAPVQARDLRERYGVSLRDGDFETVLIPPSYRKLVDAFPLRGAQLRLGLTMRACRRLRGERSFDVVVGVENEADYGDPAIQYVHYPWSKLPRPEVELSPIHCLPGAVRLYHWAATRLLGYSPSRMRANRTLANSDFTARVVQESIGVKPQVVHPPIALETPKIPWKARHDRVVTVGRIHPAKRIEDAVRIVEAVRSRGRDLSLCVVGFRDSECDGYLERLLKMAHTRDWIEFRIDVPQAELVDTLAHSRYGIHCMVEEHFGMAVAELALAGCIPLVHDSGGPPGIVGGEPGLRFSDCAEAADRLDSLLCDESEQQAVRARLAAHVHRYRADRFINGMREVVQEHLAT